MLSTRRIILTLLILAGLSVSLQESPGQEISYYDTLDYLPMHVEGALEYNLMIASAKGLQTE
ncbi:MAG TPA: hypothetical protein PK172_09580, partial [Bacteroidales bacterium]|nr:hypothetical protein [Bacteroidales bacterium]